MLVSVIIPVFNSEAFLDDCLTSVLHQDYDDWECLLIDDGASDRSPDICDVWTNKDPRFRVVHTENHGVASARNLGLSLANGAFVTFIDSDDIAEPHLLSSLVSVAKLTGAELIVGGYSIFKENNSCQKVIPLSNAVLRIQDQGFLPLLNLFEHNLLFGPFAKLYRRNHILESDALFDERFSYGEDFVFNCRILRQTKQIATIAASLYFYRQHGNDTLSTKLRPNQFSTDYSQWKELRSLFEEKGGLSDRCASYLAKRLWGIIYDGLFLFPKLEHPTCLYIKAILAIPEIEILKEHPSCFACSQWIKSWILHRRSLCFFLYFKFAHKE